MVAGCGRRPTRRHAEGSDVFPSRPRSKKRRTPAAAKDEEGAAGRRPRDPQKEDRGREKPPTPSRAKRMEPESTNAAQKSRSDRSQNAFASTDWPENRRCYLMAQSRKSLHSGIRIHGFRQSRLAAETLRGQIPRRRPHPQGTRMGNAHRPCPSDEKFWLNERSCFSDQASQCCAVRPGATRGR